MNQYMWEMTVPQIELAKQDSTHVVYLSDEQAKKAQNEVKIDDPMQLVNDFGLPVIKQ